MSHSLVSIWLHCVFSTKDRMKFISREFEEALYDHISQCLRQKFNSSLLNINGTSDHIHILFENDPNYAIRDIIEQIKGGSSHWININKFLRGKFAWQTGYFAFSVSEKNLKEACEYIANQKEHHKNVSFSEEYDLLVRKFRRLKKYGISEPHSYG